jgi:hypothetical protein
VLKWTCERKRGDIHMKNSKARLSKKNEEIILSVQEASEGHLKELCAKDGFSAEKTEDEVAEARAWHREKYIENKPKWQAFSRINKLLKSKYDLEFAKLIWEIELNTIGEKETTDLLINLTKTLNERTPNKTEVQSLLEPFIMRNSKHQAERVNEVSKLRKAAEQREQEASRRLQEAEQRLQAKTREGESLRQRLAMLQTGLSSPCEDIFSQSEPPQAQEGAISSKPGFFDENGVSRDLFLSSGVSQKHKQEEIVQSHSPGKKQRKISDFFQVK